MLQWIHDFTLPAENTYRYQFLNYQWIFISTQMKLNKNGFKSTCSTKYDPCPNVFCSSAGVRTEEEDGSLSSTSSDDDEEGDNPYSSYQQFHKELSSHDDPPPVADKHGDSTTQDDPKSELIEFETLEQGELIIKGIRSATQQIRHRHSPTM